MVGISRRAALWGEQLSGEKRQVPFGKNTIPPSRVLVAITMSWFPFCLCPAALLPVPSAACAGHWAKQ